MSTPKTGVQKLAAIQAGAPNLPPQVTPRIPAEIKRKFPDLAPLWERYDDDWDKWRRTQGSGNITIVNQAAAVTPTPTPSPSPSPAPPDVDLPQIYGEYHIQMAMSPTGVII